jgi:hypothetical protein
MGLDLENGFDCNISEKDFKKAITRRSGRFFGTESNKQESSAMLQRCLKDYVIGDKPVGLKRVFMLKTIENSIERLLATESCSSIEIDDSAWKTILVAVTYASGEVEGSLEVALVVFGVRHVPQGNERWEFEWTYRETSPSTREDIRELYTARLASEMVAEMQRFEEATLPFSSLNDRGAKR